MTLNEDIVEMKNLMEYVVDDLLGLFSHPSIFYEIFKIFITVLQNYLFSHTFLYDSSLFFVLDK